LVGDDDTGCLQPGQIERLAGCGADYGILGKNVADLRKRGEDVVRVDQIAVDLVGYDENVVVDTNLPKFHEFVPGPHAPHGVMRATQYRHLDPGISANRLKICYVHVIPTILKNQRIDDQLTSVVLNGSIERIIDWWLDEHFIPLRGERTNEHVQSRYYAWGQADPLRVDLPAVSPFHPIGDGEVKCIGGCCISKDPMFGPCYYGLHNRLWAAKIHVSYPHRKDPVWPEKAVGMLPVKEIFPFLDELPLNGVGPSTVVFFVEGMLHAVFSCVAA